MGAWKYMPSARRIRWLLCAGGWKTGRSGASVENVTEEDAPIDPQFQQGFSIEYDG